jgi:hypothetical protein
VRKCDRRSLFVDQGRPELNHRRTPEPKIVVVLLMFVLKGLGRFIWGDPDKTEIVQISSGQLYLVRPKNSVKGTSECM